MKRCAFAKIIVSKSFELIDVYLYITTLIIFYVIWSFKGVEVLNYNHKYLQKGGIF